MPNNPNSKGLGKNCPLYETGSYSELDAVEFLDNNNIEDQIRARSGCYWTAPDDFSEKPVWRRDKEGAITPPLKIKCEVDYSEVSDRLYKKCPPGTILPGTELEEQPEPPPPPIEDLIEPGDSTEKDCEPSVEPGTGPGAGDLNNDPQTPPSPPTEPPSGMFVEPTFHRVLSTQPDGFPSVSDVSVYFLDGTVLPDMWYRRSPADSPPIIEYEGQRYAAVYDQPASSPSEKVLYVRQLCNGGCSPNLFLAGQQFSSWQKLRNQLNGITPLPGTEGIDSRYIIVGFPGGFDSGMIVWNIEKERFLLDSKENALGQPGRLEGPVIDEPSNPFDTEGQQPDPGNGQNLPTGINSVLVTNGVDDYAVDPGTGWRKYRVASDENGQAVYYTAIFIPPAPQQEINDSLSGDNDVDFTPFPSNSIFNDFLDFVVIEADKKSPVYKEEQFTTQIPQFNQQGSVQFPDVLFESLICGGEYKGKTYSPGIVLGEWYEDHSFSYEVPYSKRESEQLGGVGAIMYASVDPFYNFYIEKYEDTAAVDTINETLLPNLYSMKALFEYEDANNQPDNILNPSYRKLLTLNEFIKYQNNPLDFKDAKGQYFDQWGRQVERELGTLNGPQNFLSIVNPIGQKYSNLAVTHSNVNFLKDADIKRELFPTYVEIEFSTTKNTPFSNLLEQTEFSGLVLKEIISGQGAFTDEFNFAEFAALKYPQPIDDVDNTSLVSYEPKEQLSFVARQGIDVLEWLAGLKQELQDQAQQGNTSVTPFESIESVEGSSSVFLGDMKDIVRLGPDSKNLFYKSIVVTALEAKVNELIQQNTRSYCDIVNGELAKSETVFYGIEKRRGGIDGEVVQNIYLPNSTQIDVLRFIDTQVKYGEQYTYNIYAYELVYGSRYRYEDYILGDDIAGVNVTTEPSLKLLQVPYYTYTNVILDSPPVAPDVNIIPFRGVNNRIKIAFNSNVGSCEKYPEIIEPSEAAQIKLLLASQDKYEGEKLLYESDDQTTEYEVWRMETQPFGYEDFSGRKIKTLVTDIDKDTTQKPTSGAVIDIIEPNKKYWYVFRSIDVHGHKSYPSPVYEIELVDDLGGVFPQIKVVEFATKIPKVPTKSAKRMIHVVPKLAHAIVNEEESGLIGKDSVLDRWFYGQFKLGVKDETLWGKKFKIRFTSAKTCRKVDVNFTFKTRHRKIEPE